SLIEASHPAGVGHLPFQPILFVYLIRMISLFYILTFVFQLRFNIYEIDSYKCIVLFCVIIIWNESRSHQKIPLLNKTSLLPEIMIRASFHVHSSATSTCNPSKVSFHVYSRATSTCNP